MKHLKLFATISLVAFSLASFENTFASDSYEDSTPSASPSTTTPLNTGDSVTTTLEDREEETITKKQTLKKLVRQLLGVNTQLRETLETERQQYSKEIAKLETTSSPSTERQLETQLTALKTSFEKTIGDSKIELKTAINGIKVEGATGEFLANRKFRTGVLVVVGGVSVVGILYSAYQWYLYDPSKTDELLTHIQASVGELTDSIGELKESVGELKKLSEAISDLVNRHSISLDNINDTIYAQLQTLSKIFEGSYQEISERLVQIAKSSKLEKIAESQDLDDTEDSRSIWLEYLGNLFYGLKNAFSNDA